MAVLRLVQVYVLRETEREETGWQNQVQLLYPAKGCFHCVRAAKLRST